MENTPVILCDTNILIEFYKNNNSVVSSLKKIGQNNIAISIITATELIFGAINKSELQTINKGIKSLNLITINNEINTKFIELINKYSLSHKLSIPDSIIASTAIVNNISLYTLNYKDFKYISDIKLYQS